MRILHVVHQYPPDKVGGTELYTQSLARHMTARGHSVAVFCPSRQPADPTRSLVSTDEDGARIHRVLLGPRSAQAMFFDTFTQRTISTAFAAVLQQERPDLIHVQHLMGLPAGLIDQIVKAGIPFVVTLHDYWYVCANAQLLTNTRHEVCTGPRWWVNCGQCALARVDHANWLWLASLLAPLMGYRGQRLRQALKQAARLIAPTEFVRETYQRLGMPIDQIRVVPHGIEVPMTFPEAKQHEPDVLRVAYIGGLSWQKGVHVLIEAVNELPAEAIHLSIYGDTTAFPDYAAALKQLAHHPHIDFAGRLPRAELWTTLRSMDVVVVPSLWYEASPLIIQEAFAAGVPVIASNLGALREQVHDEVDGLLFAAGDAASLRDLLLRCSGEPSWLLQLRAGIGPVRTVQEHIVDLEALYAETIASARRG